jgi:hypothetical protein
MKVVCQSRSRSELTIARCKEYAQETAWELKVGTIYTVYAQSLCDGCLAYLIDSRGRGYRGAPTWYPAEWFEVIESSIPRSWVFFYTSHHEAGGELAVWGYPELATSYEHWAGLQERDETAMLTFLRRAAEIDCEEGGGDSVSGGLQ